MLSGPFYALIVTAIIFKLTTHQTRCVTSVKPTTELIPFRSILLYFLSFHCFLLKEDVRARLFKEGAYVTKRMIYDTFHDIP